jgi:hypothetical protein
MGEMDWEKWSLASSYGCSAPPRESETEKLISSQMPACEDDIDNAVKCTDSQPTMKPQGSTQAVLNRTRSLQDGCASSMAEVHALQEH